jgi:hypothetical protein
VGPGRYRPNATHSVLAATVVLGAVGLTACGSSGGFASPLAAVRGFQGAVNHRDAATACNVISDSFKAAIAPGKVGSYSWGSCEDAAKVTFTHNAGVLLREAQIGTASVNGSNATVAIRMKLNVDDSPQAAQVKLLRQGGGWRIDDLCAVGACFKQAFITRRNRRSSS